MVQAAYDPDDTTSSTTKQKRSLNAKLACRHLPDMVHSLAWVTNPAIRNWDVSVMKEASIKDSVSLILSL
jgi:hypothetical protein